VEIIQLQLVLVALHQIRVVVLLQLGVMAVTVFLVTEILPLLQLEAVVGDRYRAMPMALSVVQAAVVVKELLHLVVLEHQIKVLLVVMAHVLHLQLCQAEVEEVQMLLVLTDQVMMLETAELVINQP